MKEHSFLVDLLCFLLLVIKCCIAEQIQYTLRDESIHIKFGTSLLNKLREQYTDIMNAEFESELTQVLKRAVEFEIKYAKDVLAKRNLRFKF